MALDPGIANLLSFIEQAGYPPMHEGTVEAARKGFAALAAASIGPDGPIPVGSVEESSVAGMRARIYRPEAEGPVPTVLFLHGGGFVIGSLETHDNVCRRLCVDTGAVVVSVDYRLAPEHPFPAAAEDAIAAAKEVVGSLDRYGGSDVVGVAGDSAGGNLSAIVTQAVAGFAAQLLIYPAVDMLGSYESRTTNAEGYFLDMATMTWFFLTYVAGQSVEPGDLRHSPIAGVRGDLPPAVVATAEFDPLRDEGLAYAAALEAAGVPVDSVQCAGMVHGFVDMALHSPAADAWIRDMNRRFAALLR
ncbi:alpha/beta hydrolase [Nocardioides sp. AE5]|uniref:alpha/beta hydrolase n=1 Tax=Nocardioides sp. AE5 TaxID=2962573 RepID=UPI002882C0B3|nr:alpha/beta hydrolase [Nocardioides sp. AE5]MDT0202662.1 alpha/beta hydrolase [Nocardioides sp. AE5]